MKEPFSAKAHIEFIWGLVYNSRMQEALKMLEILQFKLKQGKLIVDEGD